MVSRTDTRMNMFGAPVHCTFSSPRSTRVFPSRATVAPLMEPPALQLSVLEPPAHELPPQPRLTVPAGTQDVSLLPRGTLTLGLIPKSTYAKSSLAAEAAV